MLKLTYTRKRDKYLHVSVLGDAEGIRDLYWQLTHNYKAQDGIEIGSVSVRNLDGTTVQAASYAAHLKMPRSYHNFN